MEKKDSLSPEDFFNMIHLKNALYYFSLEDFIELCKNEKQYATFIDSALLLIEYDEGFLRLDSELSSKISSVIEKYRFQYTDSSYVPVVNELICQLNEINSGTQIAQDAKREHYLNWQEEVREVYFEDSEAFLNTIVDDYFVYLKFQSDYDKRIPNITIYSSLNYFAAMCPSVFRDSLFYQKSIDYLEHQANRVTLGKNHKKAIIKTRDTISQVKKDLN